MVWPWFQLLLGQAALALGCYARPAPTPLAYQSPRTDDAGVEASAAQQVDATAVEADIAVWRNDGSPEVGCVGKAPRRTAFLGGTGLKTTLVYPVCEQARSSLFLYFHSACDSPETECPAFTGAATAEQLVVCPRAQVPCGTGGAAWSVGPELWKAAGGDLWARLEAETGTVSNSRRGIVAGLSQGATVAVRVAEESRARFYALLLLGAAVEPSVPRLEQAGIRCVLLASGQRDPARGGMEAIAKRVSLQGMRVKYESLGDIGHELGPRVDQVLSTLVDWCNREE